MNRVSMAGSGAFLLDVAHGAFDETLQRRIWAAARALSRDEDIIQAVPGVNNLLVTFDALRAEPARIEARLRSAWRAARPEALLGREIDIPVTYGGERGEDLAEIAAWAGLTVEETIALHMQGQYCVAAIGAMPGFVYLTGVDPRLALPRRDTPRLNVPKGAVVLGGGHAGIMPCAAPSGWHILGHTDTILFDAHRPAPALLRLGDIVRFTRAG